MYRSVIHRADADEDEDDMQQPPVSREEVINRIEGFILAWTENLLDQGVYGPPTFEIRRRADSNVTLDDAGSRLVHGEKRTVKRFNSAGRRSYAGIFAALSFAHKLLTRGSGTASSREFYYDCKGKQHAQQQQQQEQPRDEDTANMDISTTTTTNVLFKNQSDADSAILDAASLLGVRRHELGIVAAAKGLVCGRFRFRRVSIQQAAKPPAVKAAAAAAAAAGAAAPPAITSLSHWQECSTTTLIASSWITSDLEVQLLSPVRYLLVVEKECVYTRLVDDGIIDTSGGVIVITGKGYPDLSSRACVKALHRAFDLPVLGLCDCNPHGISLLLTYKIGSSRFPDSQRYTTPSKWLGLRPSQIQERLDIPDDAFQDLQQSDEDKLTTLWKSDFCATYPQWKHEVEIMQEKCELEALNRVGRGFLMSYVVKAILQQDFI